MLGPLFGFTDDDLVRLRARAEEIQKQQGENAPQRISLYGALLLTVNSGEDTPFTGKVRAFYARLTELRRMARSAPAEQLLEEIFASTGYLAALGVMETVPAAGRMPDGLLPSVPGLAPAASLRWCGPLTLRRWQAPRGRIPCPAAPAPAV